MSRSLYHHITQLSSFTSGGQQSTSRDLEVPEQIFSVKGNQQLLLPNDVYSVTSAGGAASHFEGFNFRFKTDFQYCDQKTTGFNESFFFF